MEWYIGAIKKYAVFDGRARRKEYWMFVLFNMIFAIIASLLDELLFDSQEILFTLYRLFIFVPGLAVTVRRLHDVGKSELVFTHCAYSYNWNHMDFDPFVQRWRTRH